MIFVVLLIGLALAIVLYTGTLWLQGMIYNEPTPGLTWRAPLAALLIALYLIGFHFIARRASHFDTLVSFSPVQDKQFNELTSVRDGHKPELYRLDRDNVYKLFIKPNADQEQYVKAAPEVRWAPSREGVVRQIIVEQEQPDGNKKQLTFDADLTSSGKFKKDSATGLSEARYIEEGGGRVMTAANIGWVRTFRWGFFVGNLALNFAHLGLWFACLWLVLRYQWLHALLLALAFWVVTMLFLLPMIQT